jgi:hypothetical protein
MGRRVTGFHQDAEGLKEVIELLRWARNAVVWLQGE